LAKIDLDSYIKYLASSLFRTYETTGKIALKIDVEDVSLSINSAIPCGLILNELISNSLKHAFPGGREGEIKITLRYIEDKIELVVSDDGISIPEDLDIQNSESLGLQLVIALVKQLEGIIELDRSGGTTFKITFAKLK
jgi:two-component sensor histidine kinase